jgi:hypothetical protein
MILKILGLACLSIAGLLTLASYAIAKYAENELQDQDDWSDDGYLGV